MVFLIWWFSQGIGKRVTVKPVGKQNIFYSFMNIRNIVKEVQKTTKPQKHTKKLNINKILNSVN